MASLPPPGDGGEEDGWKFHGGKRQRGEVDDDENQPTGGQQIRRARSEDNPSSEEPCHKMARLPRSSSQQDLSPSSSWPTLTENVIQVAAKSESDGPLPSIQDAVQSLMNVELKVANGGEPLSNRKKAPNLAPRLPIAPRLSDYCAPGGPSRYLPRPEWTRQWARPVARKRPRGTTSATAAASDTAAAAAVPERPATPPPRRAAPVEQDQQDGGGNAPDNGLLPEGVFDVFASPQRRRRQNQRQQEELQRLAQEQQQQESGRTVAHGEADTTSTLAAVPVENAIDSVAGEAVTRASATPETPPPPTTFGRDYDTALHVAIRENATDAALDLIAKGASVHAENAKGVSPLILASQKGNFAVASVLLQRGASPLAASNTGCTSLLQAAHFGHCDVVNLLIHHGARIELANYKNTTPLMRAAQEGHEDIVQVLLHHGTLVNRRNNEHMSALMLASQRGHAGIVKRLVDADAEIDAMTAQDSTSLMLACKRGHLEVVRVLVASGCELMLRDSRGRTARDMAQRKNMEELLLLLSPTMQVELMRREARKKRSHVMIQMYWLLQKERASVPMHDGDMTIHQISDNPESILLMEPLLRQSQIALVRAMTLPAPLLECIASFLPRPHLWERRLCMITKRCGIDSDSSVSCALDFIDEVLEEGGFVEACDTAGVTPPPNFKDWREWKAWGKRFDGNSVPSQREAGDQPSATNDTLPGLRVDTVVAWNSPSQLRSCNQQSAQQQQVSSPEKDRPQASSVELRRDVCFLQLLAYRSPMLSCTLAAPPYNMPPVIIQQLKNVNDIQSLVRRMGSRGVHFDASVAIELVLLAGTLCLWYNREREEVWPNHVQLLESTYS